MEAEPQEVSLASLSYDLLTYEECSVVPGIKPKFRAFCSSSSLSLSFRLLSSMAFFHSGISSSVLTSDTVSFLVVYEAKRLAAEAPDSIVTSTDLLF